MTSTAVPTLTFFDTLDRLDAIVDQAGESYAYERVDAASDGFLTCVYFTDGGEPSCIVGQVLAQHGLTLDTLTGLTPELDEAVRHTLGLNGAGVERLHDEGLFNVDSRVTLELLSSAQAHQDSGDSWAESVRQAVRSALDYAKGIADEDETAARIAHDIETMLGFESLLARYEAATTV